MNAMLTYLAGSALMLLLYPVSVSQELPLMLQMSTRS